MTAFCQTEATTTVVIDLADLAVKPDAIMSELLATSYGVCLCSYTRRCSVDVK